MAGNDFQRQLDAFMGVIQSQESGGNPNAVSPHGAQGLWQIMPSNWGPWAAEAGLGRNAPMTPTNQRIVTANKMAEYYRQFGRWDAVAVAWFAGPGRAKRFVNGDSSVLNLDDGGMNVAQYVNKAMSNFNKNYNGSGGGGGASYGTPSGGYGTFANPMTIDIGPSPEEMKRLAEQQRLTGLEAPTASSSTFLAQLLGQRDMALSTIGRPDSSTNVSSAYGPMSDARTTPMSSLGDPEVALGSAYGPVPSLGDDDIVRLGNASQRSGVDWMSRLPESDRQGLPKSIMGGNGNGGQPPSQAFKPRAPKPADANPFTVPRNVR